jgi:hypothetical protein
MSEPSRGVKRGKSDDPSDALAQPPLTRSRSTVLALDRTIQWALTARIIAHRGDLVLTDEERKEKPHKMREEVFALLQRERPFPVFDSQSSPPTAWYVFAKSSTGRLRFQRIDHRNGHSFNLGEDPKPLSASVLKRFLDSTSHRPNVQTSVKRFAELLADVREWYVTASVHTNTTRPHLTIQVDCEPLDHGATKGKWEQQFHLYLFCTTPASKKPGEPAKLAVGGRDYVVDGDAITGFFKRRNEQKAHVTAILEPVRARR